MLNTRDDQTILAQCTPQGSGAIALLRMSGEAAIAIAARMSKLASGKSLLEQESHTVHFGSILDSKNNTIDQVMFIIMRAPRTFTGQDTVEITCHNNQFLVHAIIEQAVQYGARLAQPGEFTERSFLNKKIDLIQAEAINDLINAQTQAALKKSLAHLEGSFSQWVTSIERDLTRALAWCEASFEFLDEGGDFSTEIGLFLKDVLTKINFVKKTFDAQQQIKQGIRIALIGSVNAGKSSLFNILLGQQRSIVTNIAGTTRDTVEAGLQRKGNFWTLIDTAGLRQTDDIVEQEGIKRSREEAHKADIILLIIDSSRELTASEQEIYQEIYSNYSKKIILVNNKVDTLNSFSANPSVFAKATTDRSTSHLASAHIATSAIAESDGWKRSRNIKRLNVPQDILNISSLTGYNCDILEKKIEAKIAELFATLESPFLLNKRQHTLLLNLEQKLLTIQPLLINNVQYELVSYHIKDALEQLSELTGKSITEAGLDTVFKEFCVGK